MPIKKETVAKTSKNPEIKDRLAEFRAIAGNLMSTKTIGRNNKNLDNKIGAPGKMTVNSDLTTDIETLSTIGTIPAK